MYEVVFSKKAAKSIKNLPSSNRGKLKDIILSLQKSPFAYPYKKIRGEVNLYRIRLGRYRILFEVKSYDQKIVILKVELRKTIYG